MEWQYFCTLIAWWQVIMTELLPPEHTTYRRAMITTELVLNLSTQNFGDALHVMVLGSSDTLLASLPFPILVASFDEMNRNYSLHADAVILFMNNDINYLSNVPRKWLRAYFILVPLQRWNFQSMYLNKECTLSQNETDIEDTFSFLWQLEIANVILLMANDSAVQAFTFNPYHLHHCQMVHPVLVEHPWFPKVKITNLQNCHLNFTFIELAPDVIMTNERTGISKWPKKKKHTGSKEGNVNVNGNNLAGVEVELVRTLAEKMNFTAYYSLPCDGSHWGYLMGNGTVSGMAGDVFYRMSDVGFGHITPNLQLWHLLEYSGTLGVDCYGWGIPLGAGRSIPSWKTLTSEFSTLTWGLIFLALILSAIFMWTLSRQDSSDQHRYRIPFSIFCFTCNTMIAAPVTSQPTSVAVRTFVALWLMYSIVVSVAYQAELGSIVTVPWMPPDIQDLQELLESNLQLRLPWKVHAQLEKIKDEQTLSLVKRFAPTGKVMESILELTENHREFAFLSNSKSLTYYASRSGWKFHVMTEGCMMNHHTSLVMRMGSPLIPRINVLIQRFLETGLVIRWEKNYTVWSHGSKNRMSGLSMPHLLGAFMALALGQSFAFLVLLVEVLFERMLPEIPPPVNKCAEAGGETENQYVKTEEIECPDTLSIFVSLSDSNVEPVAIKLEFESDAKEKKEKSRIPNLERSRRKKSKLGVKKQESTFITKLDDVRRMSVYRQINEPQHFQFLNLFAETVNPQSMNPSGPKMKSTSSESKKTKEFKLCKIIARRPENILTRLLQKLYIARKLLEPVINDVIDRAVCSASGSCEEECDCSVTDDVRSITRGTGTEETNADCTCGDCCCCGDLNNALCQEPVVPTVYNVDKSLEMLQQLEALRSNNPKKKAAANKYFEFQNSKDLIEHLEALRDLLLVTIESLEEGNADSVAVRKTSKTSDIPNKVSEEVSSLVEYMQTHLAKLRKEYSDLCKNIQFLKDHYKDSVSLAETDEKDISSRKVASTGSVPKMHMRVTNMAGAKQLILEILGDILDFKNLLEGSSAFDRKKTYSKQKDIVNNKTKKSNSDIRGFENGGKYVENNKLYSDDKQANYMASKEVKHSGYKRNSAQYSQVSLMINSRQDFIKNQKSENVPHGKQQEFQSGKYGNISQSRDLRNHSLFDKVENRTTASQSLVLSTSVNNNQDTNRPQSKQKIRHNMINDMDNMSIDSQQYMRSAPIDSNKDPEISQLEQQERQNQTDEIFDRSTSNRPFMPLQPVVTDSNKSTVRSEFYDKRHHQPQADNINDRLTARQPFMHPTMIDSSTASERNKSKEKRHPQPDDKFFDRSSNDLPSFQPKGAKRSQLTGQKYQTVADKVDHRSTGARPSLQPTIIDSKSTERRKLKEQKYQPVAGIFDERSSVNQPFIKTPGIDYKGTDRPQSTEQKHQPVADKVEAKSAGNQPFIQTPGMDYKGGDRAQWKEQKHQPVADKVEDRSQGNQPIIKTPGIDSKGSDRPQWKEQKRQPWADKVEDQSTGNQPFIQTTGNDSKVTDRHQWKEQKHQPVADNEEDRSVRNQPFIHTPGMDYKGTNRPESKVQKHQPMADKVEDRSAGNQPFIQTPGIDSKGSERSQLKKHKRQPTDDKVEDRASGNQPFIHTPGMDYKGTNRPESKVQKHQPMADKVEDRSAGNQPFIQTPGIDSKGSERSQSKKHKRQPTDDKVEDRASGNQPFIQTTGKDSKVTDRHQWKEQKHQPVADNEEDRSVGDQPFIHIPGMDYKGTNRPESKDQKLQPMVDKVEDRSAGNQPFIETPGIDSKLADRHESKEQKHQPMADKVEARSASNQQLINTPGLDSKGSDRPQSKEQKHQPVADKVKDKSSGNEPFIHTPGINYKGTERPQSKDQKGQAVADKVEDRSAGNQPFLQMPGIDSKGSDRPQSKEQKHQPVADKVEGMSSGNEPFIHTPGMNYKGTERPQSKDQKRQAVADKVQDRSAGNQPFIQMPGIDSKGTKSPLSKEEKPLPLAGNVEDRSAGNLSFIKTPGIDSKGTHRPLSKEQKHQPVADKVEDKSAGNQPFIQTPGIGSKGTDKPQSKEKKPQEVADRVEDRSAGHIQPFIQTPVIGSKGSDMPQSKEQKHQPVTDKVEDKSAGNQPLIQTPGIDSKGADRPESKEQIHQPVPDKVVDRSAGNQPFIQTPGIGSKGTDKPQSKEKKPQEVADRVEDRSAGHIQPFIQTPVIGSEGSDLPQSKEQKHQPVADKVEDNSAGNQPFIQTPGIDSKGTDRPQSEGQKPQEVADRVEDRSAGHIQPFIQTPVIGSEGSDLPQSKEQKHQPVTDKVEDNSAGNQPFIQTPGIDSKGTDRPQSEQQKPQEVADRVEDRSAGHIQPFIQTPVIGSEGSDLPQSKEQKHQPVADKVNGGSTDNQPLIQTPIVDSNKGTERHQPKPKKQQLGTDPVETKLLPPIQDHISPESKASSQDLSPTGSKESHAINGEKQMPINEDNKIEEIEQESNDSVLSPKTASKTPFNDESLSTLDDVSSSFDDANPYFPSEASLPIFSSPEESVSSSRQFFPNTVQVVEWLSSTGMPYIPSATSMPRLRDNISDVLIGYIAFKPSTDVPYQPSESSLPDCPDNRDCERESWDSVLLVGKPSFGMPYVPSISSLPQMNQTKFSKPALTDDKAKGRSEISTPSLSPVMNLSDKENQIDVEINHPNMFVRKPSFGSPYTPSLSSLPQEIDLAESTYVNEIFFYDEPKVQSVVAKISCEIPYEASIGSLPNRTEIRSIDEEIEQKLLGRIPSSEIPYEASASSLPNTFQNATGHDFLQHGNVEGLVPVRVKGDLISSAIGYIPATDIVNVCDIGEVKSSEISQSTHDIKPVSVLKSWPVTKVNNLILKSSRENIPQESGSPLESVTEGKDTVKRHRYSQNSSETCHLVKVQYGPVDQSNNPPGGTVTSDCKGVKISVGTSMTRNKFTERKSKSCPQKSYIKKSHLKTELSLRNASYELRRVKTLKSFRSEGRRQLRGNMNISDCRKNRKDLNINMSRRKSKYITISVTKSCPDSINKSMFTYFDQKKETVPVSCFPGRKNSLKRLGVMADAFILNKQINDISGYFTVKELLKKQSTFKFVNPVQNSPIIMIAGAGSTSDLSDHRGNAPPVSSTQQSGTDYVASNGRMPSTMSELIDLIQHVRRDENQELCTICGVPNPLYYSRQHTKEFMDESPLSASHDISKEPTQPSISVSQHSAGSSGSSVTVGKYGELSTNPKVTWSIGEKQQRVQSETGSKTTGFRSIVSNSLGISHTSKENPEKLSTKMSKTSQLSKPNAPSKHSHSQTSNVRSTTTTTDREQNSIFSESQSRATTSSRFSNLSKPTTSGRDQSSVFSERSGVSAVPKSQSDLYRNSLPVIAVQPNQLFASRRTNPSIKEEQSSAYSRKSASNASRATSKFSHAQSVAQENGCYCRFEKFPFLQTTSTADATSASSIDSAPVYSQNRNIQNSLPSSSKYGSSYSVPQPSVNMSYRPHSSSYSPAQNNLIQEDITTAHAQQNYAVPKTYEDIHSSPSQYSPVIREGPFMMGTDGIVAGIQISLVPQRFVTQSTNPTSSVLATAAADGNMVRIIDPSRASFTEPSYFTHLSQTGKSQMSRVQMHHTIPLGSAPSQPSQFSTIDANSVSTESSQSSPSQISQDQFQHSILLSSEHSQPSYRSTGPPHSVVWRQQSVSAENSPNTSQQMHMQVSPSNSSVTNGHVNSMSYQQSQKNIYPQMSTNSTPQYFAANRADYRKTPYPSRVFQETQSLQTSISHSSALHNENISPNVMQAQYQLNPEVEVSKISQRPVDNISTLPSNGQRSISSKSRANLNKSVAGDIYSHSYSLNGGSGNYNYGDIPRGEEDNSPLQYERSFGDTNQRTQAYSDPPVHLSRSSAQGSLTQNSITQNVPSLGNGSNSQFQLPSQSVYMMESSYVETGDNTNSTAVDAVKPICCHCRYPADLGIPVPCNNVIKDRRVFCYPESCPFNCFETQKLESLLTSMPPVGSLPSHSSQHEEPEARDYTVSSLPQVDCFETQKLESLLTSMPPVGSLPSHSSQHEEPEARDYTVSSLPQVDTLQYLDEEPEPCSCSPEEFEDHNQDDIKLFTDDQITSASMNHNLESKSGLPVTVMRTGECCPCRIPAPQRATLLKNAASFGDRVKPIDQPCVATSREAMYPQDYMKDVVGSGQVGDPPSSSSNLDKVLWALARVSIYDDGTRTFEILEASPIPPGHYFLPENDEE